MTEKKDDKTPKAKHQHLVTPTKAMLEALAVIANELNTVKDAEKPVEVLRNITRALDKLAGRVEREAILEAEREAPQAINPLVDITAINVCRAVTNAAKDLAQQKGLPKAWEDFAKEIKETVKTTESMQRIIAQSGVAGTVVMPGEPLKDQDGNPLVDGTK